MIGALTLAAYYPIPEVTLFFNNTLVSRHNLAFPCKTERRLLQYRGNRAKHVNPSAFHGFESFNHPPLATVGYDVTVDWESVKQPPPVCRASE